MSIFTNLFTNRFGRTVNNIFVYDYADLVPSDNEIYTDVDVTTAHGQYEAYERTAIINTIIDKLARLAVNCNYFIENDEGETVNTPEGRRLLELLKKPNGTQGFNQFIESYVISLKVFGEVWLLPIKLAGSNEIKGFTVLPKNRLNVENDFRGYPFKISNTNNIRSITYTAPDGNVVDLTPFKDDIAVIYEMPDILKPGRGLSKFPSLKDHINKYLIATNANTDILRNHGALGLWVNQGTDGTGQAIITPKEREEIETAMAQKGITSGRGKDYITSHNLRHEKRSLPISDLELPDSIVDSVRTICDSMGYHVDLLSSEKASGISAEGGREKQAMEHVINETVKPMMDKLGEALNKNLPKGQMITFYYDHLPVFQQAEKETADANKVYVDTYNTLLDKGIITIDGYKQILIDKEILL